MCLNGAICCFRARCRSFSACFRMRLRAQPILNAPVGATGLSVLVAAHSASPTVSPRVPVYSVAGSVAAIRALRPVRSWSERTRRSRFGSGQHTWSPVRRLAYRLLSFSGNSGYRATRLPSRFFINCASAWCGRIRTELAVSLEKSSKQIEPMLAVVRAAKDVASTTWVSWPALLKSDGASGPAASISGRPGGTLAVFGLPWCLIEVLSRWAALSKVYCGTGCHHHHRRLERLRRSC